MESITRPDDLTTPSQAPPSGARSRSWGYRPALDGLRALAVIAVLLYHSDIAALSNGYVGVDLFFVLSGFVVTNMLVREVDRTGTVRLKQFYSRRIRRLVPAAYVTVVAVCLLSLLVLPLLERLALVRDAQASLLYVANWRAIVVANDYFAADGEASPFLHFWSLAIEEQFYLIFPLLLVGLFALQRRTGQRWLVAGGLASLAGASAIAQIALAESVSRAYYGTDTRLYQLLLGCLLAIALQHRESIHIARWIPTLTAMAAGVGLALVASSWIEVSVSTRGFLAAGLSVALIWGLEFDLRSPVAAGLSTSLLVYLGSISYSIYLWHWPVILVIDRVLDVSPVTMAALAGVTSCSIAALSLQVLESPIRLSARLERVAPAVIVIGVAVPAITALTLVPRILESTRQPQLAATDQGPLVAAPANDEPVPSIDYEAIRSYRPPTPDCGVEASSCLVRTGGGQTVLMVGDSHARMYLPALETIAEREDWTLAANILAACAWQTGLEPRPDLGPALREQCAQAREPWYESTLTAIDPDVIVLAGRSWETEEFSSLISATDPALADATTGEIARATSLETVDRLAALTQARIVLVEPTPIAEFDPLACLSGSARTAPCAFDAGPLPEMTAAYRDIASDRADTSVVDFRPIVCPDETVCVPVIDGIPVWRDPHHLTNEFVVAKTDELRLALLDTGAFD